jgi:hypothetical protein
VGFRRIYTDLPDPQTVLASPQSGTVPREPAVLYALAGALAERAKSLTGTLLNNLGTYAGRMPAEFGVLLIRDTVAVNPQFCACPSYAAWVKAHADLFVK